MFWFAVALSIGVIVGSWSSIALAPSLLVLWKGRSLKPPIKQSPLDPVE